MLRFSVSLAGTLPKSCKKRRIFSNYRWDCLKCCKKAFPINSTRGFAKQLQKCCVSQQVFLGLCSKATTTQCLQYLPPCPPNGTVGAPREREGGGLHGPAEVGTPRALGHSVIHVATVVDRVMSFGVPTPRPRRGATPGSIVTSAMRTLRDADIA